MLYTFYFFFKEFRSLSKYLYCGKLYYTAQCSIGNQKKCSFCEVACTKEKNQCYFVIFIIEWNSTKQL